MNEMSNVRRRSRSGRRFLLPGEECVGDFIPCERCEAEGAGTMAKNGQSCCRDCLTDEDRAWIEKQRAARQSRGGLTHE
jgi:hypothetical protein